VASAPVRGKVFELLAEGEFAPATALKTREVIVSTGTVVTVAMHLGRRPGRVAA